MSATVAQKAAQASMGIACLIAATACFAVLDTAVKYVGAFVSILLAVWFRYLFQALAVSAVMMPLRGLTLLHTSHLRLQLLRGALLLAVSMLSFASVQVMPVGAFTAIIMTTPLVVTLMAAVMLGERVSPLRWALVVGGLMGAWLIVRPGSALLGWTSLLPLVLVLSYASFQILTSRMARHEDAMTMHFYTGWVGALLASLTLPWAWQQMPDAVTLAVLCLIGLMGTIGHFLLIMAFARAPASTLTPYLYGQIGFAMLCGWLVFDHVPDRVEFSGIALIVLCGASATWLTAREQRLMHPVA